MSDGSQDLIGANPPRSLRDPAVFLIPALGFLTLLLGASSAIALLAGICVALSVGNPWPARTRALSRQMLNWSVVGLGAGMNLTLILHVGLHAFGYTVLGIAGAVLVGTLLGRRIGVDPDTSLLLIAGTAICGGSAIAAVASTIRAKDHQVSVALATVFLLNAIGLLVFPLIGHDLHLGQNAFGLWCALAIHDTSSVVGAAVQYGEQALQVATATKLVRALWIVPLTLAIAMLRGRSASDGDRATSPAKPPWFIAGFVITSAVVSWVPSLKGTGELVSTVAHRTLAVTLFLMGLGLTRPALRAVGVRPFVQGALLWFILAASTLSAIVFGLVA